jgi:cytochrome b6-f complex iron-sulfur subunit
MTMTRRNLLRTGWKAGSALLAAISGWTSWELLRPLAASGVGGKIKLGSTDNFKPGTATYVREGRLWVANAGGELFAISQTCPHLGCRVPFCDSSGRFECPCHGSVFDIAGEWVEGPSPRGMDRHPLSVEGQTLVVDTGKRIDGPDRGAADHRTPAKGPACSGKA